MSSKVQILVADLQNEYNSFVVSYADELNAASTSSPDDKNSTARESFIEKFDHFENKLENLLVETVCFFSSYFLCIHRTY
ncbi:hypothetical protein AYI69_g2072 [Smittium culicis]|uniref:Uncharacterized protein n=1 Tax=Smittium culicis TaxID=133412 RepID=A0A1R1YNI4_9FUNG|nr:hypothetical protein AYI69_g2072 [Smittium culicis]